MCVIIVKKKAHKDDTTSSFILLLLFEIGPITKNSTDFVFLIKFCFLSKFEFRFVGN